MAETLSLFDEIFSPKTGLLAKNLPHYEPRCDQQKMARQIWEAFETENAALFEAGTGIGKSLAYLIPALLWSYKTGKKVVISTYTISLQEQLLEKDLPLLVNALGLDLQIILAKGMGNYVCLKKLEEISQQHNLYDQSVDALVNWAQKSSDGSRSAIPFALTKETWGKVYAESEACSYVKCPHFKQCFFFKARGKVQDADLIIVNHHLLMAHLLSEDDRAILPPFSRLIVDEAHHLENVARAALSQSLDRMQLFKTLARVHSDVHPNISRLFHIRDHVKSKTLKTRLDIDLPGEKRKLLQKIHDAFDLLDQLYNSGIRWRITSAILESKKWKEEITPTFGTLKEDLLRYIAALESIENEVEEEIKPKVESALLDIAQTVSKLKKWAATLDAFFEENDVRWIERTPEGTTCTVAKLDVASYLRESLWEKSKSTIFCSATLSVKNDFTHLYKALGISQETKEHIYPSPFDFQNRTLLLGFKDLPQPNHFSFVSEAAKVIREAIEISEGGAFVLFTSYEMLHKCAEELADLPLLLQGDLPRHQLLEEFKKNENGILFGTDSFWEGVDVAGEALRLVIIIKLPFPVPSDPLLEARSEKLRAEGRDPFMEDSIPKAVMKFKQGFGRLMRHAEDRGCILCLDQRLFTRAYGKIFFKSLPECVISYNLKEAIYEEMRRFYECGA